MTTETETRTQEDLAESQSQHWDEFGGCKACGQRVELGDWITSQGDCYGDKCCGDMLRAIPGAEIIKLPTRIEAADEMYATAERRSGCQVRGCVKTRSSWLVWHPTRGKRIFACLDHAIVFGHTGQYEVKQV